MRSEPFSQKKSGNELRIMVFGDSVVNGGNLIDQEQLATSILKNKLTNILGFVIFTTFGWLFLCTPMSNSAVIHTASHTSPHSTYR